MKRLLTLLCLLTLSAGCTLVQPAVDRAADFVADRYCGTASAAEREIIRAQWRTALARRGVTYEGGIRCPNDTPPE